MTEIENPRRFCQIVYFLGFLSIWMVGAIVPMIIMLLVYSAALKSSHYRWHWQHLLQSVFIFAVLFIAGRLVGIQPVGYAVSYSAIFIFLLMLSWGIIQFNNRITDSADAPSPPADS